MRNLEREISNLARKAVKEILVSGKKQVAVTEANVADYLGVPKYRFGQAELEDQVGAVVALPAASTHVSDGGKNNGGGMMNRRRNGNKVCWFNAHDTLFTKLRVRSTRSSLKFFLTRSSAFVQTPTM